MKSPHDLLSSGYIRATQLSALNDPFEATYCENNLKDLSKYFEGIERGETLIDFIEENKHYVGVISFTEAKDNLLMWAHYADEHKGLAVKFVDYSYFKSSDKSIFENLFKMTSLTNTSWSGGFTCFDGSITPVMYRKQARYKTDKFDFDYSDISYYGAEMILNEIFQQKSDEWIYEKEHRIILRLEQADRVIVYDFDSLSNSILKDSIINSSTFSQKIVNGETITQIDLINITDDVDRDIMARALSTLSQNPKNLYLFKLKKGAISGCIFGINHNHRKKEIDISYITTNYIDGRFEFWKVLSNQEHYSLDFRQF